jgi:hypothetical protein
LSWQDAEEAAEECKVVEEFRGLDVGTQYSLRRPSNDCEEETTKGTVRVPNYGWWWKSVLDAKEGGAEEASEAEREGEGCGSLPVEGGRALRASSAP